ncbi:dihydrofolate reductase family protein [Niabella insulamsoli]|uniref:dihydrofolate reductase family protein n=1 Tax=Niabella insulamsoli TaxID=3144874 RepID=UPI0031FCE517
MRKLKLIVHISLDGFVASENGSLDKFEMAEDNLACVVEIASEADTILSGRVTHEMLEQYWPGAAKKPAATRAEIRYSNWYNQARKIVVSKTMQNASGLVLADDFIDSIKQLKTKPGKAMVIFGSPSIAGALMAQNMIDDYWLFVNPVMFGNGIRWSSKFEGSRQLKISETRRFVNGAIGLNYHLIKK